MRENPKVPNVQISKLSAEIAGICFGVWLLAFEIFSGRGGVTEKIPKFQVSKDQMSPLRSRMLVLAFDYWPLKFPPGVEL
jgi:hypothetical protein